MSNEGGSTPVIIAETGVSGGFIGVYKPHEERHHVRHPAGAGRPRPRRSDSRAARLPHVATWHEDVLHADDFAEAVRRETRRSERSGAPLSIVRYTVDGGTEGDTLCFERLLGILQDSMRETDFLGHVSTDTLVVLCPDTDAAGARGLVAKLAAIGANMPVLPVTATFPEHLFESLAGNASGSEALRLFTPTRAAVDRHGSYRLKRALDIVSAAIALFVFGPLMLFVALAVAITSKGPIIFRQQRLGKGGVPFTFFKFRSMAADVDDRIHRDYMAGLIRGQGGAPSSEGGKASYKMKSDPRVTRIGRFIRMTSIDELPQLFNVLRGDMSMVGPRPPIPYEAEHYEPWHLRRILIASPGITGLWQVEGRSRVTFSEMVRMDLRYIRHCSLWLDLKIMAKTIAVVLRCSGAR